MPRARLSDSAFAYDATDPEGFRAGVHRFAAQMGSQDTGAGLYELPPGQAVCPYHYEYGEEEWALVIDGRPSVRTPDGVEQLEPLDLLYFPKGPEGAHQIRNDGDSVARVLMWSTVVYPTATAYPDSGKVGLYTGDGAEDVIVERSRGVDYYRGETN